MANTSLIPAAALTLTGNILYAIRQPHVTSLPSASVIVSNHSPKAVTLTGWPSTLPQYFLDNGNFRQTPFPGVVLSDTDSGITKSRKRFTGKYSIFAGSVWLKNQTQYDTFINFYYNEADQGADVFTMPMPMSATPKTVRFVPGTLGIASDGGAGWVASFELLEEPQAL